LKDYEWSITGDNSSEEGSSLNWIQKQDKSKKIVYPITNYVGYTNLSKQFRHLCLNISSDSDPKSYQQAIQQDCWKEAIKNELAAHAKNKTWEQEDKNHKEQREEGPACNL
jgi:hypothetical protein